MSCLPRTWLAALSLACRGAGPEQGGEQRVVPLDAATARWVGAPSDNLGYTMVMLDLDGDGAPALVSGVPYRDSTKHRGGFYVFDALGAGGDRDPSAAVARLDGSLEGTYLARELASLQNPDGTASLVAGAKQGLAGQGDAAAVYVFDGPLGGELELSDARSTLVQPMDKSDFGGHLLEGRGDLSGDGVADLVVGAPGWHVLRGGAFVFAGPLEPGRIRPTDATAQVVASATYSRLGDGGASAWDLDGDGIAELAVGPGDKGPGTLWIFKGPLEGAMVGEDRDQAIVGQRDEDEFGEAVQGGDLDGDGYTDLVVGAPSCDTLGTNVGSVAVYTGGPHLPAAPYAFELVGTDRSSGLGEDSTRIAVRDLDGDQVDDLLLGLPNALAGDVKTGAVYLALGPLSGVAVPSDLDAVTGDLGLTDGIGSAVLADDGDGDGAAETIIGSAYAGEGSEGLIYELSAEAWLGAR